MKLLFKENRKIIRNGSFVFFAICLIMSLFCFQYYQELQKTVKKESSAYLQEISKKIAENASKTISDNFSILETISTVLKNSNVTSYEEIRPIILEQQQYWNYTNVLLVDETGIAYDSTGKTVLLNSDSYLQESMINHTNTMASSQIIDGVESVTFAIPITEIYINNTKIMALVATYEQSVFDKILDMDSFGGKGYSHMIRSDGSIVIRSSSEYAPTTGYNLLNSLANSITENNHSIETVKEQMRKAESGVISVNQQGTDEYMSYTPLASENWYLMTFVPISFVNDSSQLLLSLTILLCCFITLAFSLLFSLLAVSFYRNKQRLERMVYVDPITGGNTIQRFYELAEIAMKNANIAQYCLVYLNIEKFKVLNEQFGRKSCDKMLTTIYQSISESLTDKECVGRISADNFCILIKNEAEPALLARFKLWYQAATSATESDGLIWLLPMIEVGVFTITDNTMPFASMLDRAKLALRETKWNVRKIHGKIGYSFYDDSLRQKLFRDKLLEDMMENSLKNGEFELYLQPKHRATTEKIGGAEALVRWNSAKEGMIFPDDFISLFEKNGFIVQIDTFMFEEVCKLLRKWLNAGITPLKVSVNCSRVHLKSLSFIQKYVELCKQYGVPEKYIEIELTENIVFEDVQYLISVIHQIHSAGFGCSMDDFGSGYSSLNLIKDIPFDTLKLDKVFFQNEITFSYRTESVIKSIIAMANSLSMETVAEGVEEQYQVEMLKKLGCDYIQGYYYAKPLPIKEFETLYIEDMKHLGNEGKGIEK